MKKYKPASFMIKFSKQSSMMVHVQENGEVKTGHHGDMVPLAIQTSEGYHFIRIDDYFHLPINITTEEGAQVLHQLYQRYLEEIDTTPPHPVEVF